VTPEQYREAIRVVRPDLAGLPMVLHSNGWDSNAVEIGDAIFKFPKRPEAVPRLEREARFLALVRPRVKLAVPDLKLHRAPMLFSEHRMIPGAIIETAGYDVLSDRQKQAMAETLAGFYAALHTIPVAEAIAAGAEPKPGWPAADEVMPVLRERLPAPVCDFAEVAYAAYDALPAEEEIFGYFDGHGWNMAFDHERGVLNGVYDFADAAIGPLSREFTYPALTSTDLAERIVPLYEELTGRIIDRRSIAVRLSVQNLSEMAELEAPDEVFAARVVQWHDYVQSRAELRL
jgi:aminoglycoside phosphotransferase (APT) family kinase protein